VQIEVFDRMSCTGGRSTTLTFTRSMGGAGLAETVISDRSPLPNGPFPNHAPDPSARLVARSPSGSKVALLDRGAFVQDRSIELALLVDLRTREFESARHIRQHTHGRPPGQVG
jgi:hypothetical protein